MSGEATQNSWIGPNSVAEWSRESNWSLGHLPRRDERAVFRTPVKVRVEREHEIGRLEVHLDDPTACVTLTGSGRLVLCGSDRFLGKPVSLQVEAGILELNLEVLIAAPRFTALPGGTIRIATPQVRAIKSDLKIAVCHGGELEINAPRWDPGMHLDLATSRTRGSGSHTILLSGSGGSKVVFESLKEHDGDAVEIRGFGEDDFIAFRSDPYRSTDPGKGLRLDSFSFAERREKASIVERQGHWFLVPEGVAPPSKAVLRTGTSMTNVAHHVGFRVSVVTLGTSSSSAFGHDPDVPVAAAYSKAVRLASGLFLRPDGGAQASRTIRIGRSDDDGKTWSYGPPLFEAAEIGLSYPTIAETEPGVLLMLVSTNTHRLYRSSSHDSGQSWTRPTEVTRLISPNAPSSLVAAGGTLYLVWNRNSRGTAPFDRCPLTFGYSTDGGDTWTVGVQVETDPAWLYTEPRLLPRVVATEAANGSTVLDLTYTAIDLETGISEPRFRRLEVETRDARRDHARTDHRSDQ